MGKKDVLTKILAILGSVLAWIPILAPILFSLILLVQAHIFRFDFLMPAELFLFALAGGGLLVWAALRARSRLKWIAWSLGVAVVLLVGGQGLAVVTGLASGQNEPTGWRLALVLGSLVVYVLAVIALAVGGTLLLRDLFKREQAA